MARHPVTYFLGDRSGSNSSWSSSSQDYNSDIAQIDEFFFEQQDFLVLFVTGNDRSWFQLTLGLSTVAKNPLIADQPTPTP